jgi:predicted Zn-dependent peptidase
VPGVVAGYLGPARRSPDYYALNMLDAVLTAGESSRFQQDLIKGKESVIQYESNLGWPFAGPPDYKDPGAWAMFLLYKPNFTAQQVVDQAQGEIDRIAKEGVPVKELERVRALVRANRINDLQGSLGRARLLAQFEMFDNDAAFINSELARLMAVTPAEIQAVAARYLTPQRRAVLEIVPVPPSKSGGAQKGEGSEEE